MISRRLYGWPKTNALARDSGRNRKLIDSRQTSARSNNPGGKPFRFASLTESFGAGLDWFAFESEVPPRQDCVQTQESASVVCIQSVIRMGAV